MTGTLFTLQKLMAAQVQMQSESQVSFGSFEGVSDVLKLGPLVFEHFMALKRSYVYKIPDCFWH